MLKRYGLYVCVKLMDTKVTKVTSLVCSYVFDAFSIVFNVLIVSVRMESFDQVLIFDMVTNQLFSRTNQIRFFFQSKSTIATS